jgi:glycosyltransferase involved in cell wall biosynthesis
MTRIGMNPARDRISDYRPARVTVAVLVYIPYLTGYFEHRLEVLKLCLLSIQKHTEIPYDLLVFDNGSCEEVKALLRELQEGGVINYLLTSSENIGKIGAFKIMFEAALGEVIAYSDDDIFFYPGWLSAHLELLDGFPNVGMVSGCAVRTLFDHGVSSNLELARQEPDVNLIKGQNIPERWEIDWAESYGRDIKAHRVALQDMEDIQIEGYGLKAFAIANHNQFVTPKSVITQFIPDEWSGRLMGQMNELDVAVDEGGYLRLSTLDRTSRHLGNMVSPGMAEEAKNLGLSIEATQLRYPAGERKSFIRRLVRWRPVRWFIQGLYNRLFWLLSEQTGGWLEKGRSEGP